MVGGFSRLARVLGVSMGFCGAAVAMVALRAAGLRVEVRARGAGSAQPRSSEDTSSGAASPSGPRGSVLDAFSHRAHRNSGLYRASRGSARSAVSTLVRLILNQTALGGERATPGARAGPHRDRCDFCKALRGTTAAPEGCPRLPLPKGAAPCESPRILRDVYIIEAPRLGRGEPTPSTRHYQSTKLYDGGKGTNVTTRAARSTAVSFQTRAGAPPRPGCPATASVDAAAARPASSGATWPGTLSLDDFAPSAPTSYRQSPQI